MENKMRKIFRLIASGINRLSWVAEILAEVALLGLLLLVFHEVIVRYVLSGSCFSKGRGAWARFPLSSTTDWRALP